MICSGWLDQGTNDFIDLIRQVEAIKEDFLQERQSAVKSYSVREPKEVRPVSNVRIRT